MNRRQVGRIDRRYHRCARRCVHELLALTFPQFVAHTVTTKDGQEFTGLLIGQSVSEGVTLFMADNRAALIPPSLIASQTQSKVSLMPEELARALTVQDFRDLLEFLLSRK